MFRFVFLVLAIIGLVSLLSGALGSAAIGIGALGFVAILAFKIMFVLMILSFFGRRIGHHHGGSRPWRGPRRDAEAPSQSREEGFEEWHRMAHAREEVDSWVEGLPDDGQE